MKFGRYLIPGEHRVVAVRRHPATFAHVAGAALVGLLAAVLLTWSLSSGAAGLVWLLALMLVAWLVWRFLEWRVNILIVTDQRIMLITGLTTRRVDMLPLRRVHDLTYKRSPLGRALGYGEFLIESAGETQGLRRIPYVPSPDAIYLQISQLLFAQAWPGTTGTTDTPPSGVPRVSGRDF